MPAPPPPAPPPPAMAGFGGPPPPPPPGGSSSVPARPPPAVAKDRVSLSRQDGLLVEYAADSLNREHYLRISLKEQGLKRQSRMIDPLHKSVRGVTPRRGLLPERLLFLVYRNLLAQHLRYLEVLPPVEKGATVILVELQMIPARCPPPLSSGAYLPAWACRH